MPTADRMASAASVSGWPMPVFSRNRSSCASGSRYVPACSIGFCVPITMNGAPTGRVTPSTVTADSSITSSSADWVFGDARLISSASTMDAKIGPGWNSKAPTD